MKWLSNSLPTLSYYGLGATKLCKSEGRKNRKSSSCSPGSVPARWWERANRSIINTVFKLQHLTCNPRKLSPLTYPGCNHTVCESFKKFRKYSSYKNHLKANQGLPNWEWIWEKYKYIFLSIKQHLEFLCFLQVLYICRIPLTKIKIFQYYYDNDLYIPLTLSPLFSSGQYFGSQLI